MSALAIVLHYVLYFQPPTPHPPLPLASASCSPAPPPTAHGPSSNCFLMTPSLTVIQGPPQGHIYSWGLTHSKHLGVSPALARLHVDWGNGGVLTGSIPECNYTGYFHSYSVVQTSLSLCLPSYLTSLPSAAVTLIITRQKELWDTCWAELSLTFKTVEKILHFGKKKS